jgi:hypothetical protein
MTITTILAIYGSVVATATLLWNVFEWYEDKPRLIADIKTDMFMDESKNFATLDQENQYSNNEKSVGIEIKNIGKTPTTLKFIAIQPYVNNKRESIAFPLIFANLPAVLRPGELWSGFVPNQEKLYNHSKNSDLFIEIHHSFSKKPLTKKLVFLEA